MKNTIKSRIANFGDRVITKRFVLSAFVVSLLSLGGCGGGKIIKTVDDSVDYRSAVELPPLKKTVSAPAQVEEDLAQTETPPILPEPVEEYQEEAEAPVIDAVQTQEELADEVLPEEAPVVADDIIDESIEQDIETDSVVVDEVEQALDEPVPALQQDTIEDEVAAISARVVEADSSASRLEINADFERAWVYLTDNLKRSDVTIFTRNKSAGRLAIGCAGIDDENSVTIEKRGRWSFFNKDKKERLEYCALEAVEKRGVTQVRVLNRSGQEVATESSTGIFDRILNN